MRHFSYFPKFDYGEDAATNILVRAKIRDMIKSSAAVYYPYTVKDGERAEIISHKYYGSPDYTWLLFYANDIFDPVWDWALDYHEFTALIMGKYGDIETAHTTVHHYELTPNGLIIDHDSYYNPSFGDDQKHIVSAYEYEERANEAKRNIKIMDVKYKDQIVNELKALFKKS